MVRDFPWFLTQAIVDLWVAQSRRVELPPLHRAAPAQVTTCRVVTGGTGNELPTSGQNLSLVA